MYAGELPQPGGRSARRGIACRRVYTYVYTDMYLYTSLSSLSPSTRLTELVYRSNSYALCLRRRTGKKTASLRASNGRCLESVPAQSYLHPLQTVRRRLPVVSSTGREILIPQEDSESRNFFPLPRYLSPPSAAVIANRKRKEVGALSFKRTK